VQQLVAQFVGSASVTLVTFLVALGLMYTVKAVGALRVKAAGEIEGLDIFEHGSPAYPEYMLTGNDGTPKSLEDIVPLGQGARPIAAGSD
jgi:Amt family ammonium transporter